MITKKHYLILSLVFGLTLLALGILSASTQPQPILARPARTDKSGNISTDEVWTLAGSPYTLTGDVTVEDTVALTIEAGVEVRGVSGAQLIVQGRLYAVGTPTQPITFTSSADSAPSQWEGVYFNGGHGILRHTVVRYAGQNNTSNVRVMDLLDQEVRVESSQIISGAHTGGASNSAIRVQSGRLVLSDTLVAGNGDKLNDYGLYAAHVSTDKSHVTVTQSRFENNAGYAIYTEADIAHLVTDNDFSGNGYDRVIIHGGTASGGAALLQQNGLQSYELNGSLTVAAGETLTVGNGVRVMGRNAAQLSVLGHLHAVGHQPITFTSASDTGPGEWQGLRFEGGTGLLRNVTVRYAGEASLTQACVRANNVVNGEVRIENSRIISCAMINNPDSSVYALNSHMVISNTKFMYNGDSTTDDHALLASGSHIIVHNSVFEHNTGFGIYATTNSFITITKNLIRHNQSYGLFTDSKAALWVSDTTFYSNTNYPLLTEIFNVKRVLSNTFSDNTPNRVHFTVVIDQHSIPEDTTLSVDNGIDAYEFSGCGGGGINPKIPEDVTLTLSPEVVLMLGSGCRFEVLGNLQSLGTPTHPITIQATPGDSYGWNGLHFNGLYGQGTAHIQHTTIQEGNTYNVRANDVIVGEVRLENSQILSVANALGKDYAFRISVSNIVLSNTVFAYNGNALEDYALYVDDPEDKADIIVQECTFHDNAGWAARIEPKEVHHLYNNTFYDNGHNRVLLKNGEVAPGATIQAQNGLDGYELEGDLDIPAGTTLTLEPGVTMMGRTNGNLYIKGHLQALGANPITFTSALDSGPDQWAGLYFDGGSGHLRHALVRYAGQNNGGGRAAIAVNGAAGYVLVESSTIISNNAAGQIDYGLYANNGAAAVVSDTLVTHNGESDADYGVYGTDSTDITVRASNFVSNTGRAVRTSANSLGQATGNTFDSNGYNRIILGPGTVAHDAILEPQTGLEGYELEGKLTLSAGNVMTVSSGTTIMGQTSGQLNVEGHLHAVGTAPITFTSSLNDGPGQWKGVLFSGGTGHLDNVTLRYAGASDFTRAGLQAFNVNGGDLIRIENSRIISNSATSVSGERGIHAYQSHLVIDRSEIAYNGTLGVYAVDGAIITATRTTVHHHEDKGLELANAKAHLICDTFAHNGGDGLYLSGGNSQLSLLTSSVYSNTGLGLNNLSGNLIDASYNWWGDPSGPGGEGPGTGDEISTNVAYEPWLEAEGCMCDLGVSQQDFSDPNIAGTSIDYVLTLTNDGPGDLATDIVVTNTLPVSMTLSSYTASLSSTCDIVGRVLTCTLDSLPLDQSATLTLTLDVDPAARGTHTNTATLAAQELDLLQANNTYTESTQVEGQTELALTKAAAPNPAIIGESMRYTLTVTNHGPSTANTVILDDDLPENLIVYEAPASCAPVGGDLGCDLDILDPAETVTVSLGITVGLVTQEWITNVATVAGIEPDPLDTNNVATTTTAISTSADLIVDKVSSADPAIAGETLAYTLTVANNGPSPATGVALTETLPGQAVLVDHSAGCTPGSRELTCTLSDLNAGTETVVTLTVRVDPAARGEMTNTARVTAIEPDPEPLNNATELTLTLDARSDLQAFKTAHQDVVVAGDSITYTVGVTNAGPSQANGVLLTDTLLVSATWQTLAPGCAAGGGHVTCTLGILEPEATASVTLVARLDPGGRGNATNVAQTTAIETDPQPTNNITSTSTPISATADLVIGQTSSVDEVIAGNLIIYTLTVTNTGPSRATNVVISETRPLSTTWHGLAPGCTNHGTHVTCAMDDLAPNATDRVTLIARVDPAARSTLTNTAQASAREVDPRPGDNIKAHVVTVATQANLTVRKGQAVESLLAGTAQTYTLAVTNHGPSTADTVVLTDTPAVPLTFDVLNPGPGACAPSGDALVCDVGTLGVGATVTVTLRVTPTVQGVLTNTAQASSAAPDPATGDNTHAITATVQPAIDLSLTKNAIAGIAQMEAPLTYTLSIANHGPSTATGVELTDTLPATVTFASATPSQGSCAVVGQALVCELGSVASGGSATVTLVVVPLEEGTLVNTATVTGAETETAPGDNVDAATVTVERGDFELFLPVVMLESR